MPSAPLGVSSQPRGRLKTSTYSHKSKDGGENKENNGFSNRAEDQQEGEDSSQDDFMSERAFPHTPAVRIPLEDLIGNTEDAFNRPPPAATPADHVVWHNGPASSDISASGAGTQKSRKRARSSSPSSSQLERSAHCQGQKDPMNMNSVQKTLRTPNNDPTQELWNRYMSANISRQGDPPLPSFAHLPPSSPQTPSTTSKDSGLRRTASCGVEWPTSKPKRRRIDLEDSHSRTKDIFAASRKQILAQEVPKTSRVGLLVEKIQESLDRRGRVDDDPSSSSPLPERHSQIPPSQASPVRSPSKRSKMLQSVAEEAETSNPVAAPVLQQDDDSSSEFGDEDLDIDFFETVENNLSQDFTKLNASQPSKTASSSQRVSQRKVAGQQVQGREPPVQSPTIKRQKLASLPAPGPPKGSSSDEFDDDDDTFTTELQDLAAKIDSQSQDVPVTVPIKTYDGPSDLAPVAENMKELEDVFDDDDELWDEVAEQASHAAPDFGSIKQKSNNKAIKRYLIVNVFENQFETSQGKRRPEKMLSLKDERDGALLVAFLRQTWYDTRCTKGSYVHVIGDFRNGECIIDDANNMIILHPDHLISATVVGDSFTCTRRAALQDRVKATSRATPPQVYGHILHEMFGEALRLDQWTREGFEDIIRRLLPNYLESLYEIQVSESDAFEYLLGKTPDLIAWASAFVTGTLTHDATISDRNGALVPTAINKLLELEEHVWSPMYGLKGNIDATVQVEMQLPTESSRKTLVVPLELKTGKKDNVETHRAQTALYTLLLSDRYDVNVTCGVLYYMETSKTYRIESVRNEIRHMIIERNELACYVRDKLDLPPMLKRPHLCKSCYSKTECFTYHRLVDGGDGETSGLGETFNEMVGHLKPAHALFFKKWDDLLTKEERDSMKFRRELWTMLSAERQTIGRCFANVMIEPGSAQENPESTKINRFEYTFVKFEKETGFSFTDSQITIGEPIVISDEKGHFNLASGYVINVRPTRVVVAVDRRLQNAHRKLRNFDLETNQVFTGLMESRLDGTSLNSTSEDSQQQRLYRIDRDEFANGMATARNNVIRIMEKDLFKARELRELIVDNVPPQFRSGVPPYTVSGPASQQNLNVDQKRAIEKVLSAKDYALVLGMPGTGKTTTIAHIIRALVSQNKSVLLASYTHTAVDNILLKIKDDNIPILRIGAVNKVHPEVQNFAELTGVPKKAIEELHNAWQGSKVVATTCLGINHGLFNARTFDYCIVDEASQITLPVCLGPIRNARTFILVGDHYQLPPLVQNKEAQEGGLNVSLFKLLSDAHPASVVNLEHQYRMAEDVQVLSSELVYGGRLKCGNDSVALRTLAIPNLEHGLAAHHHTSSSVAITSQPSICLSDSSCWLSQVMEQSRRNIFLNTDTLTPAGTANESISGSRITNASESTVTAQLVATLIRSGVAPASIGVVTFYRSQLALIKRNVKAYAGTTAASELEMHTADKYQGRDKEVILLSCTRSNDSNQVGELLKDWRRVNVAITRARSKLVIIGSKSTLGGSDVPILKGIVEIMDGKGWILDLKGDDLSNHSFAAPFTQTQAQKTPAAKEPTSKKLLSQLSPLKERSPLQAGTGNASPARKHSGLPAFKKPRRIADGKKMQAEMVLENSTVMRDVMNGVDFGGVILSSPEVEARDINVD